MRDTDQTSIIDSLQAETKETIVNLTVEHTDDIQLQTIKHFLEPIIARSEPLEPAFGKKVEYITIIA